MIQLTDTQFVMALAEALPEFAYITQYTYPRLQHLPSGMVLYLSVTWNRRRLVISPANLHSPTGIYTVTPPQITVAAHRPLTAVAGAITRRLLPKALTWHAAACAWQERQTAAHTRQQAIAQLIATVGDGVPLATTDRYAQTVYSQRWGNWRATIYQDGTVSLQLTRMDAETVLTILEILQD